MNQPFEGGYIKVLNKTMIVGMVVLTSGCCHLYQFWSERPSHPIVGEWIYPDRNVGPMILTFTNDQTYIVDYNGDGRRDIWGQYSLRRGRIRMDYEKATRHTECYTPGIYHVEIGKDSLAFELIADQCQPRKYALKVQRIRKPKRLKNRGD